MKVKRSQFEKYADVEPRLLKLEQRVLEERPKAESSGENYCANEAWYGHKGLKSELVELVGHYAQKPELRSCTIYENAYRYLYGLLPDCAHEAAIC